MGSTNFDDVKIDSATTYTASGPIEEEYLDDGVVKLYVGFQQMKRNLRAQGTVRLPKKASMKPDPRDAENKLWTAKLRLDKDSTEKNAAPDTGSGITAFAIAVDDGDNVIYSWAETLGAGTGRWQKP